MRNLHNVFLALALTTLSLHSIAALPDKATAAGDSITMGFAANCTKNRYFWDLFCLLGGDQPQHS